MKDAVAGVAVVARILIMTSGRLHEHTHDKNDNPWSWQ